MADALLIIPGNITVIPRVSCLFETENEWYIIFSDNGVKFRSYSKEDVLRIILEPRASDINELLKQGEDAGVLKNNDHEQDGS